MRSVTNVFGFEFDGYWEDIGTIKSFYETTINLTNITPDFDFYKESQPIYTRRRDLPASKINSCTITQCLTADGCIITNGNIMQSVIGIRTIIESGATLDGVVCMGADGYETTSGDTPHLSTSPEHLISPNQQDECSKHDK